MIIWLASYPKSGSTWVRSFLTCLLFSQDNDLNINDIKIRAFPTKKDYENINENSENINQIIQNSLHAQSRINLDNKIKFFKTHSANWKSNDDLFTDEVNTDSVIYIVRDPRNIITSIKNHFDFDSYEKSLNFMKNEQTIIGNKKSKSEIDLLTIISSWSNHYKSWKKIKKDYLLIKYENLVDNSFDEFGKISNFLKKKHDYQYSETEVAKSIENTSFDKLKLQEKEKGFIEAVTDSKGNLKKFFNLGPENDWKNILDKKTTRLVEENFEKEMIELGYL
tara:strand:+ start:721 stop:1557 length:837 start_codon:yes stop_codon:yes gene_type:complete